MSETSKKVNVDAALRAWPDAEKSPEKWDESAKKILARLESDDASQAQGASIAYVTDEKLLQPPLGQSKEDGHNSATLAREGLKMTMPADRERDRRSLQDLAKMAQSGGLTPPPASVSSAPSGARAGEAKGDDSGLIDLRAAAASDPQAVERAQTTPLASQGLFDETEAPSVRPPPSAPLSSPLNSPLNAEVIARQPVPSLPPMSAPPPAPVMAPVMESAVASAPQAALPEVATSAAPKKESKHSAGALVAILGLCAAAAGGIFYVRSHKSEPAPVATTQTPAAEVKKPAVAAEPARTPAGEATLDPNSLPTATPAEASNANKETAKLAVAPKAGAAKPASKADHATSPAAEAAKAEAKLTQKDLPAQATGPAGALGDEMRKAVGAEDKKEAVPAAQTTGFAAGSVPQKPSQGAITGAIGAVLPSARACLGPDDPVSHASLTFGSDGSVQNVAISGGAAGKPAEACIKSALMNAKVPAFAEPSYSTRVTVRHN